MNSEQLKNKNQWISQLNNPEKKELGQVIVDFFMKDNISFMKYHENERSDIIISNFGDFDSYVSAVSLSVREDKPKLPNPTPTFKKEFLTWDRPMGLHSWFLVAYPDVAIYIMKNHQLFEREIMAKGLAYIDGNGICTFEFYRWIINHFKYNVGKLECEI